MKRIAIVLAALALSACFTPYVPAPTTATAPSPAATATTASPTPYAPALPDRYEVPLMMPGAPFPDLPACANGPQSIGGCTFDQIGQWAHPGIHPGDANYGTATSFGGTGSSYGARVLPPFGTPGNGEE